MNRLIAPVPAGLRQSGIRVIGRTIAERGIAPVRLDIGEPDLPPAPHVLDAAVRAAARPTAYTPAAGTPAFREAAAAYLLERHDLDVSPDDIVVGNGATGALMSCFQLLVRPGDEALVPVPAFPCYRSQITLAGGTVVGYRLDPAAGWEPDLDDLARRIGPRTRAIVVNSPSNPAGAVFSPATVHAISELATRSGIAVISDEVYADLAFDRAPTSALAADRASTFAVFSLSKTFSLTGWRIGFTVAPSDAAGQLATVNSQNLASANDVAQQVAVAALTGPWDDVLHRRELLAARRDAVHAWLTDRGIPHHRAEGALYQPLPLPNGVDSTVAALQLLDDGVALVPGSAFVEPGSPFLRLSLTAPVDALRAGLEIVAARYWT